MRSLPSQILRVEFVLRASYACGEHVFINSCLLLLSQRKWQVFHVAIVLLRTIALLSYYLSYSKMRLSSILTVAVAFLSTSSAVILQNGQVRITNYPNTTIPAIASNSGDWKTYKPSASQISYKGRWDSKYISWWSAPGVKFGFTGDKVLSCSTPSPTTCH